MEARGEIEGVSLSWVKASRDPVFFYRVLPEGKGVVTVTTADLGRKSISGPGSAVMYKLIKKREKNTHPNRLFSGVSCHLN